VIAQRPVAGKTHYFCALTRIDSFKATLGDLSWEESAERSGTESKAGDWRKLQALVGKHILFSSQSKSKSEEVPPSADELEAYDEGAVVATPEAV